MANTYSLSAESRTVTMRPPGGKSLASTQAAPFNPQTFLAQVGDSRTTLQCQKHHILFAQGDAANAVFHIQEGQIKLSIVSRQGKEAVVAILEQGGFFGEECLTEQLVCTATATSLGNSSIVRIDKLVMMEALQNDPSFSELFLTFLLSRNIRSQEDFVDQLFNSAEKRLARTLLLLAQVGHEDQSERHLPKISQETLAEMVGTTRSRVSFFMNRFKKLGFIECNAGIRVRRSLLKVGLPSTAWTIHDEGRQMAGGREHALNI
jgi:CRP/FNR family transcriptional regulator, cyclic AMP receptor protein